MAWAGCDGKCLTDWTRGLDIAMLYTLCGSVEENRQASSKFHPRQTHSRPRTVQIAELIELLLEDPRQVRNFTLVHVSPCIVCSRAPSCILPAPTDYCPSTSSVITAKLCAPQLSCTLAFVDYCQPLPVPFLMNLKAILRYTLASYTSLSSSLGCGRFPTTRWKRLPHFLLACAKNTRGSTTPIFIKFSKS